jgi:hypothetical protein
MAAIGAAPDPSAPAARRLTLGLKGEEARRLLHVLVEWMLGVDAAQRPTAKGLLE